LVIRDAHKWGGVAHKWCRVENLQTYSLWLLMVTLKVANYGRVADKWRGGGYDEIEGVDGLHLTEKMIIDAMFVSGS